VSLRKALSRIQDPELASEVQSLLARLQMLPEGATASLDGNISHGKIEGSAPKGARPERSSQDPPSPDVSLWAHYAFRFGKAALTNNEIEIRRLLIEANRELADFSHRPDENRITIQQERTEARDIELLLKYGEGKHAAVLAAENMWPIGWVKLVRERNGCEPVHGWVRPNWKDMGDEERYRCIGELMEQGMSQRKAAEHLGISRGSVIRYWLRAVEDAA
jgi:hypothetical protein